MTCRRGLLTEVFGCEDGDGTVGMGAWRWELVDGSMGMGAWGWKRGDGIVGMGAWGWDSGDGSMVMGVWGWEPFFCYFEILLTIYLFHFFQLN